MLRHNATRELPPAPRGPARLGTRDDVRRGAGRAGPGRLPGGRGRGRAPAPAADRRHPAPDRSDRPGGGAARRPRHPAGVRRERRGPVPRPGLRAGPGPVLRDGLPPPRHRRSDQRAAGQGHGPDRHVHPHDGLAPGRRAGVRPARALHPGLPRRVQRRGQRLPQGPLADPDLRGVHRARPRGPGLPPERWTAVDSLAWLKAMAWDLRGNMDDEIERTRLSVNRTPEQVDELYPRYPYDRNRPIVTDAAAGRAAVRARPAYDEAGLQALEAVRRGVDAIPELLGRGSGIGSNSWVVSGDHTVSGKPLLANDPHLATSLPGVWYQMGLHCTTVDDDCPFDVSGFTFAGVPGVVIGHNQRDRLGADQPRPRRHRPLPGEGDRADLPLRRPAGAADASRRGDPDRRRRLEADHGALDPARAAALRRLGRAVQRRRQRRGAERIAAARQRLRRGPGVDRADAPAHRRRDLRLRPGDRAGPSSARPRARSPYPARTSSTPTATATSATRRPARSRSARAGRSGDYPAAGWLAAERLVRSLRALRRAAQRAQPGGGLHRHRQPGGHRARTTATT